MRILFIHNNFPGQYRRIYQYLKQFSGYEMAVATLASNKQKFDVPRVGYKPHRDPSEKVHPALVSSETAILMGQAAYSALLPMKQRGDKPDIILAHSGWGGSLFVKDLFPDAKLLNYYEWYYHCHGGDGEFFRDEPYGPNDELRIRIKNTPILHDLAAQDWGQSPTKFQHGQFPEIFGQRISVLHDGVDTAFFKPNPKAKIRVKSKLLTADDEVITYIARGMEEYRGFPQFMEAVSKLQKVRPGLHVVILGQDRIAYGAPQKDGKGLKKSMLSKYDFDMERIHFLGLQPLNVMRDMLHISKAHIYLTAPFVLSWSMLEAMSAGALVIGSKTKPVEELIEDGKTGLLVPFFDVDALVEKVIYALNHPDEVKPLCAAARAKIEQDYSVTKLLPKYRSLIESVAAGHKPADL